MSRVLLISKSIVPPWNDGTKNLVRNLACAGIRYRYHILTHPGATSLGNEVFHEPVYTTKANLSLPYREKIRLMSRLLHGGPEKVYHFFFTPNPLSSWISSFCSKIRRMPTLQTVCSAPKLEHHAKSLLFGDRVIVLSQNTRQRFLKEGVSKERIVHISPGIEFSAFPSPERVRRIRTRLRAENLPLVLFVGDYEVSCAAETFAKAVLSFRSSPSLAHPLFVFACRNKTRDASKEEARLRRIVAPKEKWVRFAGEVNDMPALLFAADLATLAAETLYAKMDIPLVLLEALSLQTPIIVSSVPPLTELLCAPCGLSVPPKNPQKLLESILLLLSNQTQRETMGVQGKAMVYEKFSVQTMVHRYEELYDEVLEERK